MVQYSKTAITLVFFSILSCSQNASEADLITQPLSKKDLLGLWSFNRSDSSYAEIYYTDSTYWLFADDNCFIKKYDIGNGDTLSVDFDPKSILKFKLHDFDSNSFILTGYGGSIVYKRIKDSIFNHSDWKKIIVDGDWTLTRKYRLYYFAREDEYKRRILEGK